MRVDPDDPTPTTARDMTSMVEVLEGRHGVHAAGVAEFFASLHELNGDASRAWAWVGVADLVRLRERQRLVRN